MADTTSGASADNVPRIGSSRGQTALFAAALGAGTAATILGKILLGMPATMDTSNGAKTESFARPVALTFGTFLGLALVGLTAHVVVVVGRLPCPGYDAQHSRRSRRAGSETETEASPLLPRDAASLVPWWMYAYLAIPALFDVLATSVALLGLLHLDASVYQLLRGSGIIFLALLRQNALGQRLFFFQWYGVGWSAVAVTLVAVAAIVGAGLDPRGASLATAVGGVACLLLSTLVQSTQLVLEEKMMREDAPNLPPLLLMGVEGLWGSLLCGLGLYPLALLFPGSDHGSFENPRTTWNMLSQTPALQLAFGLYLVFVCVYNVSSLQLTVSLSSVWHFILNNIQPTTVWATDLLLYYAIVHRKYGEPWDHRFSWVQLMGLLVLLYGTLIFNAPDPPSLRLEGQWYALGLNLAPEYAEIELQRNPAVPGLVKWLGSALGRRLKFG